jgi:hypothetical protein
MMDCGKLSGKDGRFRSEKKTGSELYDVWGQRIDEWRNKPLCKGEGMTCRSEIVLSETRRSPISESKRRTR